MTNNLTVTTIQTSLFWEDVSANLKALAHKIKTIKEPTDIIVLPEMFTTGFSMNTEILAEEITKNSTTINWLKEQAKKSDALIIGSIISKKEAKNFNTLVAMFPDGTYEMYDKRHLFRFAKEDESFSAGTNRLILEWKGWRICPLICFDLRFPVFSRNNPLKVDVNNGIKAIKEQKTAYDCLIYIANWPAIRSAPWEILLKARAIENQCYTIGVNRVGTDGKGIVYSGNTVVLDAKGAQISNTQANEERVETTLLSAKELAGFRAKFPVALDADNFEIS